MLCNNALHCLIDLGWNSVTGAFFEASAIDQPGFMHVRTSQINVTDLGSLGTRHSVDDGHQMQASSAALHSTGAAN